MDTNSIFSTSWNATSAPETENAHYSQISVLALIAFFFGLVSFFVFFTLWLSFLGILGTLFGILAVTHIRRSEGILTGLALAYLALVLSVMSLVAVSVMWPVYHYSVRQESDKFFRIWFAALAEKLVDNDEHPIKGNIPLARGLSSVYWERPSIENHEKWWKDHYENQFSHKALHEYGKNHLVRTLLALGSTAKATYYKTLECYSDESKDHVTAVYAVTYPGADQKPETFFVKMKGVRRFPRGDVKSAGWELEGSPVLFVPEEFFAKVSPSSFPALTEEKEE